MWGVRAGAWGLARPGSTGQNRPLLQGSEPIIPPELIIPGLLLADPRQGYAHPLYVALGVLFAVILIGSLLAYLLAPRLLHRHRLHTELLRRLTGALALVSGLGLFWILARVVGMPLFARPLWLWFTLLALVATIVYAGYYWIKRYPDRRRAYEEAERKRRWLPTPRRRAAARRR
jgi:hypothetical protein